MADLTPEQFREILRTELEAGVRVDEDNLRQVVVQTLSSLGMAAEDPKSMQRDLQFLRELRETSESIRKKGVLALVGAIVAATLALIWAGLKAHLGG